MGKACCLNHRIRRPVAYGVGAVAFFQVALHHHIILSRSPLGHLVVGDVRDLAELLGELALSLVHDGFEVLGLLLEGGHGGFGLVGLLAQPLFHESANLGCFLLALGEQVVELLLGLAAFFVGGLHGGNGLGSALEVLFLKTADDTVGFFIDKFKC